MFDTLRVDRDGKDVEVQFKVYLGKHEPFCNYYGLGETIPDLPKVRFAEWGIGDDLEHCIVEFDGGRAVRVIWPPETEGYVFPELPRPRRHPERVALVWAEEKKRMDALADAEVALAGSPELALARALLEPIRCVMDYPGIARTILNPGNYAKIDGKWRRIRPI